MIQKLLTGVFPKSPARGCPQPQRVEMPMNQEFFAANKS